MEYGIGTVIVGLLFLIVFRGFIWRFLGDGSRGPEVREHEEQIRAIFSGDKAAIRCNYGLPEDATDEEVKAAQQAKSADFWSQPLCHCKEFPSPHRHTRS